MSAKATVGERWQKGVQNLHKKFLTKRAISALAVSLSTCAVAMVSPFLGTSSAQTQELLVNGSFSSSGGGWTGQTSPGCVGGAPSIGGWTQNALQFSYVQNSVSQSVSVPNPGLVMFSASARTGSWSGTYSVSIADSNETVTTGVQTAQTTETPISLSLTTTTPGETVLVTISGKDAQFWAGCYGPIITNASLLGPPSGTYSGGGCGPYYPIYVTGATSGAVWGSGPFTDDSNFSVAAVFLGLVEPGESAWLEPYSVDTYPTYEGGSANGVTTSDWNGSWCGFNLKIYGTPTPVPKYLNPPRNVSATSSDGKIYVNWDAPEESNAEVEQYAIFFSTDNWATGFAVSSTSTSYIFENPTYGATYKFKVRADNDTESVYSEFSNEVSVLAYIPYPTITRPGATVVPASNFFPEHIYGEANENQNLNLTAPSGKLLDEVLFASYGTPVGYRVGLCHAAQSASTVSAIVAGQTSATVPASNSVFGDPCGGTPKRLIVAVKLIDDPSATTTTTTTSTTTTTTTIPETTTTTTVPETTTTTTTTLPPTTTTTTEPPVETTTTTAPPQTTVPDTTTTTTEPPTTTTTTPPPVDPTPDPESPSSDEVASIGTPEDLTSLLEEAPPSSLSEEALIAVVANPVFTELSPAQVTEVIEAVADVVSDLSDAQKSEISEALSEAPESVKEEFEGTVDVYGAGFDDYVPTGSNVDVQTRRSLIAATTVLATAAAASIPSSSPSSSGPSSGGGGSGPRSGGGGGSSGGGGSGGGSGGSGGGSAGGPDNNNAARKEEEELDTDYAGEIAGPDEEDDGSFTRNSIYKYGENNMKKFSIWGFVKKFAKETAALSFTLAGSAVVFVTLSGQTRQVAIIATGVALLVHYIFVMSQNDE